MTSSPTTNDDGRSLVADQLPVAVVTTDLDGIVTSWNPQAHHMFGWTADEALGQPIRDLTVPPESAPGTRQLIDRVAAGRPSCRRHVAMTRDRARIAVQVAASPLTDPSGRPVGIVAVSMPATSSHWQLLVEHAADALSLHAMDGTYRYVSPAFEDLLGSEPRTLVGRDPYELFHPHDVDDVRSGHTDLIHRRTTRLAPLQYRMARADNTYIWVETVAQVTADGQAIVAVTRRIAARRSLMHALAHERLINDRLRDLEAERTAFLTTIAHRARQPITAVLGFIHTLRRVMAGRTDTQTERLLQRLHERAAELAQLIGAATTAKELSAHSARVKRSRVDLRELATTVIGDFAAHDAPVHLDVDEAPTAFADGAKLEVALRALLQNAVRHTPVGTSIWIRARPHDHGVVLSVEDDGPGVPDRDKSDIFEAFRGDALDHNPSMGLGLYIVAEVAAAHGGRAWVEDRPGGGAVLNLLINQRGPGAGRDAPTGERPR